MRIKSNKYPRMITINKRFVAEIYPEKSVLSNVDVRFPDYTDTIEISDEKLGLFLINNYDGISIVNEDGIDLLIEDDLDLVVGTNNKPINGLKKIAYRYGCTIKEITPCNTQMLKVLIRKKRLEGAYFMTEEERKAKVNEIKETSLDILRGRNKKKGNKKC